MQGQLTQTGIPALPEVARGTHLCLFYDSAEDLLDVLVPYVQAGLEADELCVVIGDAQFDRAEFERRLTAALPSLPEYLDRHALEFVSIQESYRTVGGFDAEHTLAFWRRKAQDAVSRGFSGMRVNGDEGWLQNSHWASFIDYECALDRAISDLPAVIMCAYPLKGRSAVEVLDAARAHQVVVAKRDGKWNVLELADVTYAKHELNRLRVELERRVLERTQALSTANERLKAEIAERNRVERALRESEERFAKAFRSSPIIMGITNADDDRIIDVNNAFTRTSGYDRSAVIGRTAIELGIWTDPAERVQVIELMRARGAVHGYEVVQKSAGAMLDLLLFTESIEVGGRRCFLWAAADQTAKKQAERALVEQQWLLNESERLSGTGSWQCGVDSGTVIWSRELYRMHGQTPETFVPAFENWLALVHPHDRAAVKTAIDNCIAARSNFSIEHRIVLPNGQTRHVLSVGYCELRAGDRIVRVTGYARDITDKREAEQALRSAREELEALSRKLVQVQEAERNALSRELHDRIGQNLTAMGISLDLLRSRIDARANGADRQELLGRIEDVSVLLEAIVGSIEDVVSELRPPILDELGLSAAFEWYAGDFTKRTGIQVNIACSERVPRLAPDAELAIFRIFQEALTNVAKHAKAQSVDLRCERIGDTYGVTICDDGVGPHSPPQEPGVERGFGLAIMRERALAMGGTFKFSARPDAGACVIVRLPIARS